MKKILKHPFVLALGACIIALFIWCVYATSRIRRQPHEDALPFLRGERNAIFSFWHSRMLLMPVFRPPGRKMHVLISHHRDGELIARAMHCFGFGTVRGSTNRGGAKAAANTLDMLSAGDNVSITPDGPRGPAEKVSPGIVQLARISGLPIIPVSFAASRHRRLNSWDRFLIAYPFGHVGFVSAAPLYVPSDADDATLAAACGELEKRMLACGQEADRLAQE